MPKKIDENITHNRLSKYKNSVKFVLTKIDLLEITNQEAQGLLLGEHVCVPIVTKSESLTEAQNLTSERSIQQTKEDSTFWTQPLERRINSTM